jgi:hypothetical protein
MSDPLPIGGRNLNIGVRHGLLDAKHTRAMGKSILLFAWLVSKQTKQTGLVLGGRALSYADIAADSGWVERTIRRWMKRLDELRYISVKYTVYRRMIIHVLNQKKFDPIQLQLPNPDVHSLRPKVAAALRPEVADNAARSGRINHRAEKEHTKKEETPAAKSAAGDSLHYQFVEFAAESFHAAFGQHPSWGPKDFRNLKELLARAPHLTMEELKRRFTDYLVSTDSFIRSRGGSLAYFCSHSDQFISGPILQTGGQSNGRKLRGQELLDHNLTITGLKGPLALDSSVARPVRNGL